MKKTLLSVFLTVFFFGNLTLSFSQSFSVSGTSDMVRIFEDGYKLPPMSDTLRLFGIRGEIVSGQATINAKKSIPELTVIVGTFMNREKSLPVNAVEWNFVGSIPLSRNTPNQPLNTLVRQAPASFPEYLMEERAIGIKAKSWKTVWLTIAIPENTSEGIYTGKVVVTGGKEEQILPVTLTVYPLSMPVERHLKVVEWYNTGGFSRFHGIREAYSPEWFSMLRKYANNMVAHRQNVFEVPMESIKITKSAGGGLQFDFTRFDQIAEVFWKTGRMDYLETGELTTFGSERWNSTEISLKDFSVTDQAAGGIVNLPGKDVIPFLMPSFENHLRQKGWLDKTIFGIKDEPSLHNAGSYNEVSSYIHRYAPDLTRMDAIETTQVLSGLEIAIPKLDHFANWYESYRDWQNKGNELWFYTVGIYQGSLFLNKTIDMPLIDSRLMHWLNYRSGATGYLHWGWNQWNENPFEDVGEHIGDAWHVYPAKTGVLNSIRWEEMRNGIQDYEYLWMLEKSTCGLRDSLGSLFGWISPEQRGKEIAGRVIHDFAEHTDDPDVVNKAKMALINELMDLDASPGLYVQTNPPEDSFITSGSTVEVMGWTEPGTAIVVNGKEIPVSERGFFGDQFHLTLKSNEIIVQAAGLKSSREIRRTFMIK